MHTGLPRQTTFCTPHISRSFLFSTNANNCRLLQLLLPACPTPPRQASVVAHGERSLKKYRRKEELSLRSRHGASKADSQGDREAYGRTVRRRCPGLAGLFSTRTSTHGFPHIGYPASALFPTKTISGTSMSRSTARRSRRTRVGSPAA